MTVEQQIEIILEEAFVKITLVRDDEGKLLNLDGYREISKILHNYSTGIL